MKNSKVIESDAVPLSAPNSQEDQLRVLLQTVKDYKYALDESSIVAITNQKGIIQYVNEKFCEISQYAEHELLGQDHRIINSGFHSKGFIREIWTTIAKGMVWRGEIKNKAKDGTYYWVYTTIVPFLNGQGKPYQYMAIRYDITQKKNTEQELISNEKLYSANLEKEVKDRTIQLENVNKELEAFSYSVSHDLRAPLRAVNGYARMLVEDYGPLLDMEANRLLGIIQQNALKMGILIDDLLSLSRLGRKELRNFTINMTELAEQALSEISKTNPHKAIVTIYPLLNVMGDASLLYQVMLNLLSNAIKYSSKKAKPAIEISSILQENEQIYCIKDNGAGFNMNYSHKLFGVFQRLHTEIEFEGTGVGLAIVKRIINRHQGRVWAEGILGEGAAFYFSLPVINI
jgi:PAS domain S-box-containing protein